VKSRVILLALGACVVIALAALVSGMALSGRTAGNAGSDTEQAAHVTHATENYGTAPSYVLTDQNGKRFSSKSLNGRIQVVSYLFPYCTSYCPIIGANLASVERRLPASLKGRVDFVAFNVDPGETGPKQMSAFLHQYGINARDPHWHYLTGSPQQMRHVVTGGFHIFYKKVTLKQEQATEKRQKSAGTFHAQPEKHNALAAKADVNYDIVHNDSVEVVDAHGTIRAFFDSGDKVTPKQILAAVRQAARS
jgi:cytochrome oxidase Cu insertion factor (SCO1/SenC/PrrC family)